MRVLGIDPGLQGAMVLTDGAHFEYAFMPLKVEGKNKSVDFQAIHRYFLAWKLMDRELCPSHVFLERAVAFGMGLTGAFNYGRGFGFIEIAIDLAGFPITQASPREWTKVMHEGISADLNAKVRSQIAVERLFPQLKGRIPIAITGRSKGKMHEGVVDALLIAGYGLRKLGKV